MKKSVIKEDKKEYCAPQIDVIQLKHQVILELSGANEDDGDSQEW